VKAARGRTIVLTTQILSEAEELCDEILIVNRGRQIARGDLHALKLMSQSVYELSLTFDALPDGVEAQLAARQPLRLRISGNTVEVALKEDERAVLGLVNELAQRAHVLRVEVSGASLEDIFVELTQGAEETRSSAPPQVTEAVRDSSLRSAQDDTSSHSAKERKRTARLARLATREQRVGMNLVRLSRSRVILLTARFASGSSRAAETGRDLTPAANNIRRLTDAPLPCARSFGALRQPQVTRAFAPSEAGETHRAFTTIATQSSAREYEPSRLMRGSSVPFAKARVVAACGSAPSPLLIHLIMKTARILIALIGIALPYLARVPRGAHWLDQYIDGGLGSILFFQAFNVIAWGSLILVSFAYRRAISLLVPAIPTFGFEAWAHYSLDLTADAQASIALVMIPVFAVPLVAISGLLGYLFDRILRRPETAAP
jgi:hypothetical protein